MTCDHASCHHATKHPGIINALTIMLPNYTYKSLSPTLLARRNDLNTLFLVQTRRRTDVAAEAKTSSHTLDSFTLTNAPVVLSHQASVRCRPRIVSQVLLSELSSLM